MSSLVTTDTLPADTLTCPKGAPVLSSTTCPLITTCCAITASGANIIMIIHSLFIFVLVLVFLLQSYKKKPQNTNNITYFY